MAKVSSIAAAPGFMARADSRQRSGSKTIFCGMPSDQQLEALPLVQPGEFELGSENEIVRLRRRLYSLNRSNVRWAYRSFRGVGFRLFIWRLER